MTAALKLNLVSQEAEPLSSKPRLGEKRPQPRLVWENPKLSAGTHKEKSKARLGVVSGQSLYAYVENNPINFMIHLVYSPAFLRAHQGLYEMNFITK